MHEEPFTAGEEQDYLLKTGATKYLTFTDCTFDTRKTAILAAGEADGENTYVLDLNNVNVYDSQITNDACRLLCIDDSNRSYQIKFSVSYIGGAADSRTCAAYYFAGEQMGDNTTVTIGDTVVWQNGQLVSHAYSKGYSEAEITNCKLNDDGSYSWDEATTCHTCGWKETTAKNGYRLSGDIDANGFFATGSGASNHYEAYAEPGNSVGYSVYADTGYVLQELLVDEKTIPKAVNRTEFSYHYDITDHNATIEAKFSAAKKITVQQAEGGFIDCQDRSAPGAQV